MLRYSTMSKRRCWMVLEIWVESRANTLVPLLGMGVFICIEI